MKTTGILYKDISQDLKTRILNDTYALNTLIPTESELSDEYGVSKITIRNAVEILVSEGYLQKKSGKGTMVISNRPFNNLSRANSFSTILESQGHEMRRKVLSTERLAKDEVSIFSDSTSPSLTELTRLYFLDERPYIYTQHIIAIPIENLNLQLLEQHSLYNMLKEANVTLVRFEDSFSLSEVPDDVAEKLLLPNNSVLKRVRHGYDQFNSLVEFTTSFYNTAVHDYQIDYEV